MAGLAVALSALLLLPPFSFGFPLEHRDNSASFSASSGPAWNENGSPFLTLDNGVLFFFQDDGNIVVHQENTQTVFWASGSTGQTCGGGRCKPQFQTDGNLVAVDYGVNPPHPFWSTGTNSYSGHSTAASIIVFRSEAPFIQLLSSSGFTEWETVGTSDSVLVSNDDQAVVDAAWGSYWQAGNDPFLAIGDVLFFAQNDGNFVVHQQGTDTVYWASGSSRGGCEDHCHLQFQNDGNLVYVDYSTNPPTPFWNTDSAATSSQPWQATRMIFRRTDPYIQLIDANGNNVWHTQGQSGSVRGYTDPVKPAPPNPPSGGGQDPCGSVPCVVCYGDCSDPGVSDPGDFDPGDLDPGDNSGCTSDFRRRALRRALDWTSPLLGVMATSALRRRFDSC